MRKTNRKEALWWEIWNRLDTKLSKIIELLEKSQDAKNSGNYGTDSQNDIPNKP